VIFIIRRVARVFELGNHIHLSKVKKDVVAVGTGEEGAKNVINFL
jgi:hypothetical protein